MKRIDIFKEKKEGSLAVVFDCPSKICNYRCPYCFHQPDGFNQDQKEFLQWSQLLDALLSKIQNSLYLVIGPCGEPLMLPEWWSIVRNILKKPNVKTLCFVSNLSRPIANLMVGIDPCKIGVKASIHPTQYKDDKDLRFFIDQAIYLKSIGVHIVVNYVLAPYQLKEFTKYQKIFNDIGIQFTANVFRGIYEGKVYPEANTEEELDLMKGFLSSEPFIFEYQSHAKKPLGESCSAGNDCIYITMDGAVYNCPFDKQRIGSLLDKELPIYNENCLCGSNACECHWSIGLMEHVYRRYNKSHFPIIGYKSRDGGEIGKHPYE